MTALREIDGVGLRADSLIALRQIALRTGADPSLAALPGGFATRRKGNGQEVADVRDYVSGDDIRHLDRGTTARTGRLHVRQFQEERDRVTLLVADFRPSMFWGISRAFRSVAAAEALSLIGWRCVEEGGRVGLCVISAAAPVVVPPRGRVRGMLDVIGGLVEAHGTCLAALMSPDRNNEDPPLNQSLTRLNRLCPPGSEIVLTSGFDATGGAFADEVNALNRRRTLHFVQITDAEVQKLPQGHYPIRTQDGRQARVMLAAATSAGAPKTHKRDIAGHSALIIDAGDSMEQTARRIAASFPASAGR